MLKNFINHIVFRNSLALGLVQISNYVAPLIVLSVLTSTLSVEKYSILAFVLATVSLATVVTDFGFNISAVARVSQARQNVRILSTTLTSVLLCKFALFSCLVLLASILIKYFPVFIGISEEIIAASLLVFANVLLPIWFFQGLEKMWLVSFVLVTSKLLGLTYVIFAVDDTTRVASILIAYGVCSLMAASLAWIILFKMGFRAKFSLRHLLLTWRGSIDYFLSRAASAIYTVANGFLLGSFGSIETVGAYSIAEQVYRALQGAFMPVYQSLYPFMAREKEFKTFYASLIAVLIVFMLVVPLAYFLYPAFVTYVSTPEYLSSVPVFNIMLIMLAVNLVSSLFGFPFLVAIGKSYVANSSIFFGFFIYCCLIFFLWTVEELTAENLIVASLCAETIILLIRLAFVFMHRKFD